ncbi:MAG: hypothetical protein NC184_06270 [Roseburia sp.]|nr:hypothetical protein [Roseburia sp.]
MEKLGDRLKASADADKLRLHTPGHKGELCSLDLTELSDGSFPSVAIAEAEREIADVYGARHARMLCGGSSQGVKAAVYFAGSNGIVDINSHRSVFDGFKLAGKRCSAAGVRGALTPITVKDIASALAPDIGVVVVTSPTYYGYVADVDGIREFCRAHGLLFAVDGAHGAHFGASKLLPEPFAGRCDVCNVSTHKTLSALTQTAVLLDNLSDSDSARLSDAVDIMGTTSPSYLLYASIDGAVRKMRDSAAAYERLYEPLCEIKAQFPFLQNDDFTRLVLDCSRVGADATAINAALCRRGVYSEMTDGKNIVFIFTAADTPETAEKFASALRGAIEDVT